MIEGKPCLLLDANVWLDFYIAGRAGFDVARRFMRSAIEHEAVLMYPTRILADVFYEIRRDAKKWFRADGITVTDVVGRACRDHAWDCVKDMNELAIAVGMDGSDVWLALKLQGLNADLEDNFVLAAAERARADYLVTSDRQLIQKATVAALTPQDMCAVLEAGI